MGTDLGVTAKFKPFSRTLHSETVWSCFEILTTHLDWSIVSLLRVLSLHMAPYCLLSFWTRVLNFYHCLAFVFVFPLGWTVITEDQDKKIEMIHLRSVLQNNNYKPWIFKTPLDTTHKSKGTANNQRPSPLYARSF